MRKRLTFRGGVLLTAALAMTVASCSDRPTESQVPVPVPEKATPEIIFGPGGEVILNMAVSSQLGPEAATGDAIFRQSAFENSSGTGNVQPFLKTSTNDLSYNAFNTSGTKPATVSNNDFTRDLPLSFVPTVLIGGAVYREFRLDINEPNTDPEKFLSLEKFEVWVSPVGLINTTGTNLPNFGGSGATLRYQFPPNTWMKTDGELSSGSGGGDVFFYVPETAFGADGVACPYDGAIGAGCGKFVYLTIHVGDHFPNDGGNFEEFAVRKLPYVTKTAAYKYDESVTWDITKKVKDSQDAGAFSGTSLTYNLWNGDSKTAQYEVKVDKTVTKTNNRIEGVITITNPTGGDFTVSSVTDTFNGTTVAVTCPAATVPANGSLACPYTVALASAPTLDANSFNRATATIANANLTLQIQGKVLVAGPGALGSTTGSQTVNVTDNFNATGAVALGSASDDKTFTPQNRTFACAADKGTKTNIARIVETNQTASADVTTNCFSLTVEKTATPAQGDVFDWTIDKTVTPASRTMYVNDQGEFKYTVAYTKGAAVSTRTVSGTVTITNPAASSGNISVAQPTDNVIAVGGNAAVPVTLNCGAGGFPRVLAPGATIECTYSNVALPNGDARTNRASATGTIPTANSKAFTGDAAISFAGVVATTTNNAVTIADPNDPSTPRGPFTATGSFDYTVTKTCTASPSGPTNFPNTATMTSTDGLNKNDGATISVTCVAATVTKTAPTTFRRTWTWDITKSRGLIGENPAPTTLLLDAGQTFAYPYAVRVYTTGSSDDNFKTSGTIQVSGSASVPGARSFVMSDAIAGGFTPAVTCTGGNPQSITGAGPINCTWAETALPDNTTRVNTATATLQNVKYLVAGGTSNLAGTTTPFTGTANVTFGTTPTTKVDDCVKVVDVAQHKTDAGAALGSLITNQLTNSLFNICVSGTPGAADQTINYTTNIGPMQQFAACGAFRFDNTATLTTDDTGATDNSTVQTPITVDCPQGCTLTQGYWKTHNASFGADRRNGRKGPPVHDWTDNTAWTDWNLWKFFGGTPVPVPPGVTAVPVPTQGNPSWFTNFATPPQGNAYYQASHQFMAAMLNVANGSPGTAINTELAAAYTFFLTATPNTKWDAAQTTQLLAWSGKFASYNEGTLGTLHCSEDATSSTSP